MESAQTMDALLFLARYYKDPALNRLDDAELYCQVMWPDAFVYVVDGKRLS